MSGSPWVVISCGAAKLDHPAPAGQLYIGGLFKDALAWARSVTSGDRVLILSARHGLIKLSRPTEPYNLRMGDPGSVRPERIAEQLEMHGIREAYAVCGQDYRATLSKAAAIASVQVTYPFLYLPNGSLGYLRRALRRNRGRIPTESSHA
ncbi:Uncharacterised protein [Mycobacteroides abscessus subsp. abscessus]|nr:Uncharacterised protein [Mycobacteroides abscessus subsp. abscessus]